MKIKKIAILFSGEGTNMETLIKSLHNEKFGDTKICVSLTLTNNPFANGIKRSKTYNIAPVILDHKKYSSREEFDKKLVEIIKEHEINLCVLAGFMRILTRHFTQNITAINIHPSLLPLFKGANALKRSYDSDMKVGGVTTHMVTDELDSGEIIDQKCFDKEGLSFEDFKDKITQTEHSIYPESVKKVLLT